MKQFQKYGVAAAVASVATGVVATEVSKKEAGDLAIVPYYTVLDGKNTGIHIINTTAKTQVVKVRLRRGADSADALDFNLIMSPYDEWTANLGPNPNGPGVQVSTNDTTCTAPKFENDGKTATMPTTFATGAEEGYMEIIGMGQPMNALDLPAGYLNYLPDATRAYLWSEANSLSAYAVHDDGVPVDCDTVRRHFYRIYDGTSVGVNTVKGVHYANQTSSGLCSATSTRTGGSCDNAGVRELLGSGTSPEDDYSEATSSAMRVWYNLVPYTDTPDDALKVSWMITDSEGGLEIGDNAVMVSGFSNTGDAMMTNQVPLNFGSNGKLRYDPLNFELPNLAYGAWGRGDYDATDKHNRSIQPCSSYTDVPEECENHMFDDLRAALDAEAVVNDWAAFDTDSGSVATDWVVTLPGQYVMNSNVCTLYSSYAEAATACFGVRTANTTSEANLGIAAASLGRDGDKKYIGVDPRYLVSHELPLRVAGNTEGNPLSDESNLLLWDREELPLFTESEEADDELGFSPGGSAGDPTVPVGLNREVNVIKFNDGDVLGTAAQQDEPLGLGFTVTVPGDATKGWGMLMIDTTGNQYYGYNHYIWEPGEPDAAATNIINPNDARDGVVDGWGALTREVNNPDHTAVVAFAAWERSFADQAGNYGRAVEHSTISSAIPRMARSYDN